jgi:hypothetical protein
MRIALLLAAAIVPLLMPTAGAQVAKDQPETDKLAHNEVTPNVAKQAVAKRWIAKPAASKSLTEPPLPGPSKAEGPLGDLVIDSMDLRQFGRSAGIFSIPLTRTLPDPIATAPAPATLPMQVGASVTPVQAETLAPINPIPPQGAIRIEPVAAAAEPTILLRADTDVGLAAFRVGSETLVVLDAPIAFQAPGFDLDPAFAKLTSRRTQDSTVIRIPMALAGLRLARTSKGWMVTVGAPPDTIAAILPRSIKGGLDTSSLRFPVSEPSRVVIVVNPQTGDRLLVGTQGSAGQAVASEWQQTQFSLLPTLQGVVVAAISDDIRLHREADGFTLSTSLQADSAIMGARPKEPEMPLAGAISRLFDIPNGTSQEMIGVLKKRILAAGSAHALAKSGPRLRVAEAMLALGMDVEAQSVVDVATAADPALMDQPRAIGLRAIASTLAGRLEEAKTLADPRLTGSTEIELWRALLQVAKDEATAKDARSLADGLPLVLAYPNPLRDRLLAGTLETMALNGQSEAAQTVLNALPDDRNLTLARGMALEMANKPADALKAYDQVAARSDRLPRYKAVLRATELRIKGGEFDAQAGADALDRALLGWRGAKQELDLRLRIADLRLQAGQWRQGLTVLRDGREIFPTERAQLDAKMAKIFIALLTDDAAHHLSPINFVALYDQNLDLVQDISWTEKAGTELVDRLVGLDLPGRAEPIMARLVAQSTDPVRRAVLGARLASVRMSINDPAGATDALASTVPPANAAVDPALMQARQLLYARGASERGNKDAALSMLDSLDTADADAERAEIYAGRKDWARTVGALTALEHKKIATADLTDAQRAIVMRLAVAATLGTDAATLARVADTYGPAMAKGSSAAVFRVMTSAPATGTADLPRAFEEIELIKQLGGRIGSAGQP